MEEFGRLRVCEGRFESAVGRVVQQCQCRMKRLELLRLFAKHSHQPIELHDGELSVYASRCKLNKACARFLRLISNHTPCHSARSQCKAGTTQDRHNFFVKQLTVILQLVLALKDAAIGIRVSHLPRLKLCCAINSSRYMR